MKKVSLLLGIGLLCISLSPLAGEVITNDTGEDATGLRVVFSSPVLITGSGDVFTTVDPQMLSYEFIFSGGTVETWGSHWFNYAPATSSVIETEWLTGPLTSQITQGSLTRDDLLNLGRSPTYEEIMSVIAEYPGPNEPLYVPSDDEAIWLTDLEGHADIYDNDSIKINYAAWFDQSQITKIEVYRNGIKMRFLPDTLDVVTKEQMKTFDGNPLEHSPASSHADHANAGYVYSVRLIDMNGALLGESASEIENGVTYQPEFRLINIDHHWYEEIGEPDSEQKVKIFCQAAKGMGYNGISANVSYFINPETGELFEQRVFDANVHPWKISASYGAVQDLATWVDESGLYFDLRIELHFPESFKRRTGIDRFNWIPSAEQLRTLMADYSTIGNELGAILTRSRADIFSIITEARFLETYGEEVITLLNEVSSSFLGYFLVEQDTLRFVEQAGNDIRTFIEITGDYYDWVHPISGKSLMIGYSCWFPQLSDKPDPEHSEMLEEMTSLFSDVVSYHRKTYPDHKIIMAEIGSFDYNNISLGYWLDTSRHIRADQEFAGVWNAYMGAMAVLDMDGFSLWNITLNMDEIRTGYTYLFGSPINNIIGDYLEPE